MTGRLAGRSDAAKLDKPVRLLILHNPLRSEEVRRLQVSFRLWR